MTTLTLTDEAVSRLRTVLQDQGAPEGALRVFVTPGGCSGFSYGMSLEQEPADDDDVVEQAGVRVLEGESEVVRVNGTSVAIAGLKGFGGGFAGACGTDFGEPEMKAFIRHTRSLADRLSEVVASMQGDIRVVLLHYAPVEGTLQGERLEIYPFLGSYLLAEAVDACGADLIIHGHAHGGCEHGVTPAGIQVRNVALPVIKHAYNLYCVEAEDRGYSPTSS